MSFNKKPKTINPDEVDPSVYYYDEVYDEIKAQEKIEHHGGTSRSDDEPRTSKYIHGIQETASKRKLEKELRRFKKYARDREEAKDLSENDIYITAAYRKKLAEISKLEEENRRLLEDEKTNRMNFNINESTTKTSEDFVKSKTCAINTHESKRKPIDASHDSMPSSSGSQPPRRRLERIEDRKEYLRNLLAKRTVGEAYQNAVQRYIQRKVLARTDVVT